MAVVGVEAAIWKKVLNLLKETAGSAWEWPLELKTFADIHNKDGDEKVFPATGELSRERSLLNMINYHIGGDLFLYVQGNRLDYCFEIVNTFMEILGSSNIAQFEHISGFKYMGGRVSTLVPCMAL